MVRSTCKMKELNGTPFCRNFYFYTVPNRLISQDSQKDLEELFGDDKEYFGFNTE